MLNKSITNLFLFSYCSVFSQELMKKLDDGEVSTLFNNPTVITLVSGDQLVGTLANLYLQKGKLIDVSIQLSDATKRKLRPKEIENVRIRTANPVMFTLKNDSGRIIKKVIYSQYIFEHPFRNSQKAKPEMIQLLNPGYDRKVKIYSDPNFVGSPTVSIKGTPLSSGINALMAIKGNDVFYIRESSYQEDFKRLFGECGTMVKKISPEQISFGSIATHALLFDSYCVNQ